MDQATLEKRVDRFEAEHGPMELAKVCFSTLNRILVRKGICTIEELCTTMDEQLRHAEKAAKTSRADRIEEITKRTMKVRSSRSAP